MLRNKNYLYSYEMISESLMKRNTMTNALHIQQADLKLKKHTSMVSFLDDVSEHCYLNYSRYIHAKNIDEPLRYQNGKKSALSFMQELCYYSYQQEKQLKPRFIEALYSQLDSVSILEKSDYTQGIEDAINELILLIADNSTK